MEYDLSLAGFSHTKSFWPVDRLSRRRKRRGETRGRGRSSDAGESSPYPSPDLYISSSQQSGANTFVTAKTGVKPSAAVPVNHRSLSAAETNKVDLELGRGVDGVGHRGGLKLLSGVKDEPAILDRDLIEEVDRRYQQSLKSLINTDGRGDLSRGSVPSYDVTADDYDVVMTSGGVASRVGGVKSLANVPMRSFDQYLIDSDLDGSIHSSLVREKLASAQDKPTRDTHNKHKEVTDSWNFPISTLEPSQGQNQLALSNKIDLEMALKLRKELMRLDAELQQAASKKKILEDSLSEMNQRLNMMKVKVKTEEKNVKDKHARANSVKLELMQTEQKCQSARRQLEKVTADLRAKSLILKKISSSSAHHSLLVSSPQRSFSASPIRGSRRGLEASKAWCCDDGTLRSTGSIPDITRSFSKSIMSELPLASRSIDDLGEKAAESGVKFPSNLENNSGGRISSSERKLRRRSHESSYMEASSGKNLLNAGSSLEPRFGTFVEDANLTRVSSRGVQGVDPDGFEKGDYANNPRISQEIDDEKKRARNFKEFFLEDPLNQIIEAKERLISEQQDKIKSLEARLQASEAKCKEIEQEKIDAIASKAKEAESARLSLRAELVRCQQAWLSEGEGHRKQLELTNQELERLKVVLQNKSKCNEQLLKRVEIEERERDEERRKRDFLIEDRVRHLNQMITEKEKELQESSSLLAQERRSADQKLSSAAESERNQARLLQDTESRVECLQSELKTKQRALELMQERNSQYNSWLLQLIDTIRADRHDTYWSMLDEERDQWDLDKEAELASHVTRARDEMIDRVKRLQLELEQERTGGREKSRQVEQLKEELEIARQRLQIQEQLNQKQQPHSSGSFVATPNGFAIGLSDNTREILDTSSNHLQEKIGELEQEKEKLSETEKKLRTSLEREKRELVKDLNDESNQLLQVLSANGFEKKTSASYGRWKKIPTDGGSFKLEDSTGPVSHSLQTALEFLRCSLDDARRHIQEQQERLDGEREKRERKNEESVLELERIKRKFESDKRLALEKQKAKLTRDHLLDVGNLKSQIFHLTTYSGSPGPKREPGGVVAGYSRAVLEKDEELRAVQRGMESWKRKTSEALAQQFKQELNRQLDRNSAIKYPEQLQRDLQLQKLQPRSRSAERSNIGRSISNWPRLSGSPPPMIKAVTNKSLPIVTSQDLQVNEKPATTDSEPIKLRSKVERRNFSDESEKAVPRHELVNQLQAELRDLLTENNFLRVRASAKKISKDESVETQLRDLEKRVEIAEQSFSLADRRANQSEHSLNQKLTEISGLKHWSSKHARQLEELQRLHSIIPQLKHTRY